MEPCCSTTSGLSMTAKRIEIFSLATILVFASHAVPAWAVMATRGIAPEWVRSIGDWNYYLIWTLVFSLLLVSASPRYYGLRIGQIRRYWGRTALVCLTPVVLTAVIYPHLGLKQYLAGGPAGLWLVSPLAQDIIFMGYLFAKFDELFPWQIHRRIGVRWGLVLACFFFAFWHLPSLGALPVGYFVFQLCYTFVGGFVTGLSRQWTGSLIYCTAAHMAVNWLAR
jgi:membrane protease YdiL (CAAX protease family)